MDDPNNKTGRAVPDQPDTPDVPPRGEYAHTLPPSSADAVGVAYGMPGGMEEIHEVAHWHTGLGWQRMRPRIGEILSYICAVDGCDYQVSRTQTD